MTLKESYAKVRPGVVAIISRVSTRPDFPEIIGTGVVIRPDGLILTNSHVVKAMAKLPRIKGGQDTGIPAMVLFLHNVPGRGMFEIAIEITGVVEVGLDPMPENYYGQSPDIAFLTIGSIKNVPYVEIAENDVAVGSKVGILGFPMGTKTLRAPGWIHQVAPTLQQGIVSAQLPFECDAPHEIMIDAVTEGGSSGSPIFDEETGKLVGLLYGGLRENYPVVDAAKRITYLVPTSHTLAVSNFWIRQYLEKLQADPPEEMIQDLKRDKMDFEEYIKSKTPVIIDPRSQQIRLKPVPADMVE